MKSEVSRLLAEASLLAAEQALRARPMGQPAALIEALAHGVSSMLSATSVSTALPEVLANMARVVPLQRLSITEAGMQEPPLEGVLFHWCTPLPGNTGPHGVSTVAPSWQQTLAGAGRLPEWLQPLASGSHVLTQYAEASEPVRAALAESRTTALLAVPIMLDGRHWGQILFEDGEDAGGWYNEELRVLCMLADVIGAALTRERFVAQVREREAQVREREARIALLARSDALTGLANRITFNDRLRQAFAASQRGAHAFAVLYLDLDRFKEINDTLGHQAGDLLLQQLAARLRQATREIDLVARLGGDEFAIVQSEISDSASAGTLAEKVIDIVAAPFDIAGSQLHVGVSIGIALYSSEARTPDELLAHADQALYRAKHAGRGRYRFHSDQIDHETRAQLELADGLRGALERNELEIRYQPQVELASGRIMGMEALLRWIHPKRGVLLPEDFLPIAEKYGIMQQLGRWVLGEACRQMSLWRAQQIPVPVVAVNVALAQIRMGREFVRDVVDALYRWALKPSDLELDVTELVLARSTLAQSGVLEELRQLGVGIAIDDFGAQFSSLDYLRTYRVSRLKIARGMVAAADAEPGGGAMIRAILSLARELGIEVVAEGVETESQCRLLVDASAHAQGQGFYFSHAMPAEQTMRVLRAGVMAPAAGGFATGAAAPGAAAGAAD